MFPLVTLITPCHNGEAHLEPYLRGILSQTYPNVQFIFINDGSTDKTEAMILSAENKIRAKGWDFIYVSRHHSGQAAAMNIAIPLIKGKYFSQIDSDDIIEPQYLEKYCYFLEKNPVYKFCYARIAIRRENESSPYQIRYRHATPNRQDNFFNDLIYEQNVPPLPFYMCETEAFNSVVKHPIYEGAGGQNWQILLPMAYFYQCGYLDDILATYIERDSSHSHREQKRNDRITNLKKILFATISRIDMPNEEKIFWYDQITTKYIRREVQSITLSSILKKSPAAKIFKKILGKIYYAFQHK